MIKSAERKIKYPQRAKFLLRILAITVLSSVFASGLAHGISNIQLKSNLESLQISGIRNLTATQIESLVTKRKIVAYWTGPQSGFEYRLNATSPGEVFVKYVPILPPGASGRTTRTSLREIATFEQENAFDVVRAQARIDTCQNFINADGNAVHIDSAVPNLIYVGIRGKPIQVVMFDPRQPHNLALACAKNVLVQIGEN